MPFENIVSEIVEVPTIRYAKSVAGQLVLQTAVRVYQTDEHGNQQTGFRFVDVPIVDQL